MAGLQLEILAVKVARWTQCCIVPRPPYLHNRGVITGLTGLKKASYRPATLLHFSTSLNCSVIMLVPLPPYYHTSMVWLLFWLKLLLVSLCRNCSHSTLFWFSSDGRFCFWHSIFLCFHPILVPNNTKDTVVASNRYYIVTIVIKTSY